MAWEWSHTVEAYQDAQTNAANLPDSVVAVIWAEWRAAVVDEYHEPDFDQHRYRRELRRAHSLIRRGFRDTIDDDIWRHAEGLRTCTNGGHEAWLCPFGCGCHMVSFSLGEED